MNRIELAGLLVVTLLLSVTPPFAHDSGADDDIDELSAEVNDLLEEWRALDFPFEFPSVDELSALGHSSIMVSDGSISQIPLFAVTPLPPKYAVVTFGLQGNERDLGDNQVGAANWIESHISLICTQSPEPALIHAALPPDTVGQLAPFTLPNSDVTYLKVRILMESSDADRTFVRTGIAVLSETTQRSMSGNDLAVWLSGWKEGSEFTNQDLMSLFAGTTKEWTAITLVGEAHSATFIWDLQPIGVDDFLAENCATLSQASEKCQVAAGSPLEPWSSGIGVAFGELEPETAVPACREALHEHPGIAAIQFRLGRALDKQGDYAEAFALYTEAAEQGYTPAQNNLGSLYLRGAGVAEDAVVGADWIEKAATGGFARAAYNLGRLYEDGSGVPQDTAKALEWFRSAAEAGDVVAQSKLGSMYMHGDGVSADYEQSFAWYEMAAKQGDAYSEYVVGWFYDTGNGVQKDSDKAFAWYERAAHQGSGDAQFRLAQMYVDGIGTEQNDGLAFYWAERAAKQGNSNGQNFIGAMYEYGRAVKPNVDVAIEWYSKAAAQDHATALANLDRLAVELAIQELQESADDLTQSADALQSAIDAVGPDELQLSNESRRYLSELTFGSSIDEHTNEPTSSLGINDVWHIYIVKSEEKVYLGDREYDVIMMFDIDSLQLTMFSVGTPHFFTEDASLCRAIFGEVGTYLTNSFGEKAVEVRAAYEDVSTGPVQIGDVTIDIAHNYDEILYDLGSGGQIELQLGTFGKSCGVTALFSKPSGRFEFK